MPDSEPLSLAAGTYDGGGGRGVSSLSRTRSGAWSVGAVYPDARNASFSVYSARHRLHYIVDERDDGRLGVHRHGPDGWERLATIATEGGAPCHVALDRAETMVAVANYMGGSIALFRLDPQTGLPDGPAQLWANSGSGPNAARQQAPHAHWVGFDDDGRWLYQTDLGTDEILAFPIYQGGLQAPHRAYAAPPGSGPRHLLLHPHVPTRAYLASELANTLTVLDGGQGTFKAETTLSTLPPGWHGDTIVAHLAINRATDRLYVSNRGHDSIAVFALDATGYPTLLQHVASGGASPRFFLLLEDCALMIVAHEKAQTVTALAIAADGRLTPTGESRAVPGVGYLLAP
ncbi:beta-propeller fold lactonase family protein [Sphingomonas sp. RB3P16]|uniref:lactonase family protein n=1 Tax=Parasphingomonas frigoris TaxID=3096163 RepID=UPI002FC8EAA9